MTEYHKPMCHDKKIRYSHYQRSCVAPSGHLIYLADPTAVSRAFPPRRLGRSVPPNVMFFRPLPTCPLRHAHTVPLKKKYKEMPPNSNHVQSRPSIIVTIVIIRVQNFRRWPHIIHQQTVQHHALRRAPRQPDIRQSDGRVVSQPLRLRRRQPRVVGRP